MSGPENDEVDELNERIRELTLERDTLRTMVVAMYPIARWELYRLRADPAPDSRTAHYTQELARFVRDAQTHVEIIGQIEQR